jgi:hypothetical protein
VTDEDNMQEPLKKMVMEQCSDLDPYECESAIKRLNDYLDHQLSDGERLVVLKHLEICRPCLRRFTFEQTLIISLRQKITCVCIPGPLRDKLHALLEQQ